MIKTISLRVFALTLFIVCAPIFISCTVQNSTSTTSWEWSPVSSWQLQFQLPERFIENDIFLSCAMQSVDTCMQEVTSSNDGFQSISCDEFLSEMSRESCRYMQATTEAQTSRDPSLCSDLNLWSRERCEIEVRLALALDSGDISTCENFSDTDKIDCNNRIIFNQASLSLNADLCEGLIASMDEIEFCRNNILTSIDYEQEMQENINEIMNLDDNIEVQIPVTEDTSTFTDNLE